MNKIYVNDVTGKNPQKDFFIKTVPRIGETIVLNVNEDYEKYKVLQVTHLLCDTKRELISLQIDVIKL